jgi:hypothetical protein
VVAFSLGPWLTSLWGFQDYFLSPHHGIGCDLDVVAGAESHPTSSKFQQGYLNQLKQVIQMGDLNRLHVSVFPCIYCSLQCLFMFLHS